MPGATRLPINEGTLGYLNYLDAAAHPSLYRNGKVLTRRDPDGSDAGTEGVNREKLQEVIRNARLHGEQRCTLMSNGFELLTGQADSGVDFLDQHQVVHKYYGECAQIVQAFTGGHAFAFDHNVRSASGK